jgi:hypothetical protein
VTNTLWCRTKVLWGCKGRVKLEGKTIQPDKSVKLDNPQKFLAQLTNLGVPRIDARRRAALKTSNAISHKKKPRLVATGFLVEIGNCLADFELAPNDAS